MQILTTIDQQPLNIQRGYQLCLEVMRKKRAPNFNPLLFYFENMHSMKVKFCMTSLNKLKLLQRKNIQAAAFHVNLDKGLSYAHMSFAAHEFIHKKLNL